jgi:DNA-binding IclR family transcriptional regulator
MLEAIRAKGYAVQDREINPRTTGIAIPIALKARYGVMVITAGVIDPT